MTLTVVAELGSSACPAEKGVCVRCPEPNYWAPASCRAAPPEQHNAYNINGIYQLFLTRK